MVAARQQTCWMIVGECGEGSECGVQCRKPIFLFADVVVKDCSQPIALLSATKMFLIILRFMLVNGGWLWLGW